MVVYNTKDKTIIAVLENGDKSNKPEGIEFFYGTIEEFQEQFPDYKWKDDNEFEDLI